MIPSEKRERYREVLAGHTCVHPASVYDPFSARMADSLGYNVGMLAGSVASAVVLGAPDLVVLTLTEFADLAHRITRASDLSLMVDADHGYGNALSVVRTVEELEASGLAALTIEDTRLPEQFRQEQGQELLSIDEGVGKLRAALAARKDVTLSIIGRTSALGSAGMEELIRRVKRYAEVGVDGLFITGISTVEQLQEIRQATDLPLLMGNTPAALRDGNVLSENGVKIALTGHQPFWASVKAAYEAMKHLSDGGSGDDLRDQVASTELTDLVTKGDTYAQWRKEFLR
ncbi:MAG: oxaloacetate decarboxylase [SAR202 cluster bacterium Io17-Chloro-G3]|nr:MAG: oxaloacetate decarboxylase [SAR202 cluster bacterium Io17-Chloro-G3]